MKTKSNYKDQLSENCIRDGTTYIVIKNKISTFRNLKSSKHVLKNHAN